jgi:hypothetical protein
MSDSNKLTVVEKSEIKEGPIVAVQYPSTVDYGSSLTTGKYLATKYYSLMRIDVDDKEAYSELCQAIKDVAAARTDCTKEEDVIKAPLNAFRKLVIDTGKKIRKNIASLAEEPLKAEKKRVDDIKANRLLELQKLWINNLGEIRNSWSFSNSYSMSNLEDTLEAIDNFDISKIDLGDYEEDAKAEIANKIIALEAEIELRKEAEKVRLEQVKLKKEQDEKEAKLKKEQEELLEQQQRQKVVNAEIEAYAESSERETKALMAEVAALKAEKESNKKEKTVVGGIEVTKVVDISKSVHITPKNPDEIIENITDENGITNIRFELSEDFIEDEVVEVKTVGSWEDVDTVTSKIDIGKNVHVVAFDSPESVELEITGFSNTDFPSPFDEPAPQPQESPYIDDNLKMDTFVGSLVYLLEQAPVDFDHNEYVQAVNRVVGSLHKASTFLSGIKKD